MTRGRAAICCLCILAAGCAPRIARRPPAPLPSTTAIVAALARREQATRGLRLSLTVRISGGEQGTLLPAPAYLAVDDAGDIRLQVLSPFGMTVLDLAIHGDAYVLTLPLRGQKVDGTIDPRVLADPTVPVADRMVVALALMFRPKATAETCIEIAPATVGCRVAGALTAQVTVDDGLRPTREAYVRDDGVPLLVATYDDYRDDTPTAVAGTLVIADPASDARMSIRVQRVRTADERRT